MIESRVADPNFVILDTRTPEEFDTEHIKGAVNIDFYADSFRDDMDALDKEKTYLIYCRSGNRSGMSFKMMKKLGFQDVYNMEGGIVDWSKSYPVVE